MLVNIEHSQYHLQENRCQSEHLHLPSLHQQERWWNNRTTHNFNHENGNRISKAWLHLITPSHPPNHLSLTLSLLLTMWLTNLLSSSFPNHTVANIPSLPSFPSSHGHQNLFQFQHLFSLPLDPRKLFCHLCASTANLITAHSSTPIVTTYTSCSLPIACSI